MEVLRRQNPELFSLLDRVATDQHRQLLIRLLDQLKPHLKGEPTLLVMPSAMKQLRHLAEATVDLEMRGKTPEPIDFGGYTLAAPLLGFPFDTLYLTRPLTNKLLLTALIDAPLHRPLALWLTLDPNHPPPGPEGFEPRSALMARRIRAPHLPLSVTDSDELISTSLLLRESLETTPLKPQDEEALRQEVPYPLEEEVGRRFFPPLQVIRTADDILRPEAHLLRLPTVPLLITYADGLQRTLIQLETVPSWPQTWRPEEAFTTPSQRVALIGEGLNYNLPTLLNLMKDLAEALTTKP